VPTPGRAGVTQRYAPPARLCLWTGDGAGRRGNARYKQKGTVAEGFSWGDPKYTTNVYTCQILEIEDHGGTGLSGQIEAGIAHISRRGYTLDTSIGFANEGIEYVPGVFQEDYTGKVIYRPAINHLLDALERRSIKVVVIHRTSRLGRRGSVQEALEALFKERGARADYVTAQFDTTTPTGRAMRRMLGVFDELDYENVIEQLKEGKAQRVKAGSVIITRPPYGYRVVKERDDNGKRVTRLAVVEEEAKIILMIFEWYVYEDLSITAIAKRLTEMHILTRGDEPGGNRRKYPAGVWAESVISKMLQSETYIGCWYYRKTKSVPVPGRDKSKQVPAPPRGLVGCLGSSDRQRRHLQGSTT
jgi:DNA invertase Pin-like site-specific DNA recombinase